jgi:iron complex transport system substrate-binding protein
MLFAAGAGDRVVGTSDYSDEPEAARAVERVGDAQSFNLERILALRPDVVIVWSGGSSPVQMARLERVGLPLYHHRLTRLDDIAPSLLRLGRLAGTEASAQASAAMLTRRITALRQRYASASAATVLIQVWNRPIYTVGGDQIMTDVVHACGMRNVFEDLPDPGPAVTLEAVLQRDPQIVLALAPDERAAQDWLQSWHRFPSMKAVRTGRLMGWTDQRLSRLGPSMVAAAEDLCRALPR